MPLLLLLTAQYLPLSPDKARKPPKLLKSTVLSDPCTNVLPSGICQEVKVLPSDSSVQRILIMAKSTREVNAVLVELALVRTLMFIKLVLVSTAVLNDVLYTPLFQESLNT